MVFTKEELYDFIHKSCEHLIIDQKRIYQALILQMDWSDDDARDITVDDIELLTDRIACDADSFLTELETAIAKSQ